MDQNAIGTAIGDIQSVEDASQNQLPFVLISNPNKQPTRLLANSGEVAPIEGQSRWFSYEFKEPICLLRLTVEAPDYPDYRQFDIECHRPDGTKKLFTAYSDGSNLDVHIRCLREHIIQAP